MQVVDQADTLAGADAFYTVFASDLTQNKYGTLTGTPGARLGR